MSLKPPTQGTPSTASNDVYVQVLREVINPQYPEYGAKGDGVTDDSTALANFAAALATAGKGEGHIPAGDYLCNSTPFSFSSPNSMTITGAGRNATRIIANGNINLFNITGSITRFRLADMWLGSDSLRASGTALNVIGAASPTPNGFQIERVRFQNMPNLIHCENLQQSRFNDLEIVNSISSAVSGVAAYFKACVSMRFRDWMCFSSAGQFGDDLLLLDSDCDTIMGRGLEFKAAGQSAIHCKNSLGGSHTGPRLVRFSETIMENSTAANYFIEDGRDIRLNTAESANAGTHGYHVTGGTSIRALDTLSWQNGQHGYLITGAGITGTRLTACDASNNSQTTTNTYDGCNIGNNTSHVTLLGCRFGDYILSLTNKQRNGLTVGTGTDYILYDILDVAGNQTGGVSDASPGAHSYQGTVKV